MRQSHHKQTFGWDRCRILGSYPNVPVVVAELCGGSNANRHPHGSLQLLSQRRSKAVQSDLNNSDNLQAENKCRNSYFVGFCPRPLAVQFQNPQKIHFEILHFRWPPTKISTPRHWKIAGDPSYRRGQILTLNGIFYRFFEIMFHIWVEACILQPLERRDRIEGAWSYLGNFGDSQKSICLHQEVGEIQRGRAAQQ